MINFENVRSVLIFDSEKQDIADWAQCLYDADLAFHLDDDLATVTKDDGSPMFTADEVELLNMTVSLLTDEEQDEYFDTILAAHRAQEHYFNTMDGPSLDDQIREALGRKPAPARPHPDQVSFYEAARLALVNPDVRKFIAKHMDITDAEALRLRDELTRILGKVPA